MSRKYQVASIESANRCVLVLLFAFLISQRTNASAPQLSSDAYISLLTCAPGKELYSAFGHSALRVVDPVNRIDITFNYGTFDFDQPDFYYNYAMGKPIFMLSVSQTKYFLRVYVHENRSVVEDVLQLTQEQKQQLFDLLEENHRPENRDYRYDYVYDNCSTRIRDLLMKVTNNTLVFDTTRHLPVYSFRQLMDLYLSPQPWGDLGIDLALSSVIDTPTTPYYYMFLPDFLREEVLHAKINQNGSWVPLVSQSATIYNAEPEEYQAGFFTPLLLFWLVFVLFLGKTVMDLKKIKVSFAADVFLFVILGLMGVAIAHISFFSDHHAARNYNLLWAMPLHLVFAFFLPFAHRFSGVRYYFLFAAISATVGVIGGLTFLPQQYNAAFYPLMLTLMMRGVVIFKKTEPQHITARA